MPASESEDFRCNCYRLKKKMKMNKNTRKNIKIIIAAHKPYAMPEDEIYLPVQVGSQEKESIGFQRDDEGDNISAKNPSFCELTGLYWAWKNLTCDYLGLAHYRRHFTLKMRKGSDKNKTAEEKMKEVLHTEEVEKLTMQYPIILPQKRNYYIETLYSHYAHSHYAVHLDVTREIIRERHPEYLAAFDAVMKQRSGYMFNMYIMRKDLSDQYCEWLFDILFELEKRMEGSELSTFQGRFYGRVSEIIFNVWLKYQVENNGYQTKEIGCMHMEPVNWWKKGGAFLKAKFLHQKYKGSF